MQENEYVEFFEFCRMKSNMFQMSSRTKDKLVRDYVSTAAEFTRNLELDRITDEIIL